MAQKAASKSTEKSKPTPKSAVKSEPKVSAAAVVSKKVPMSYQERVLRLWMVSIVVAVLFLVSSALSTLVSLEESEIRRETYITNLNQFYQQEAQACAGGFGAEGQDEQSASDCLEVLNESNRFAELLKKWGGEEMLLGE